MTLLLLACVASAPSMPGPAVTHYCYDSILILSALAARSACPYAVVGGPVREAW